MADQTAEFLRAERERYEYLLLCAKDVEHEELAWETIVAKMTVEDFVTAAKEVLAFREASRAVRGWLPAAHDPDSPAQPSPSLKRFFEGEGKQDLAEFAALTLALVAECKANRRVVETGREAGNAVRSGASPFTELAKLMVAIEVHDQVTGATP